MKRSLLGLLFVSLLCIGAEPDPGDVTRVRERKSDPNPVWRPAPRNVIEIAADPEWLIVPKTDIYEVVPSQMSSSLVRDIPEVGFKQLAVEQAKALTGHYYSCPSGKGAFLVRAVYTKGGLLGRLRVERKGNSLAVVWGTFGVDSNTDLQLSALVVNLDFTPDEVYFDSSSIPSMP